LVRGPLNGNEEDSDDSTDDDVYADEVPNHSGHNETGRQLRDCTSIKRPATFEEYIMSAK
jgi:hypothetical protein